MASGASQPQNNLPKPGHPTIRKIIAQHLPGIRTTVNQLENLEKQARDRLQAQAGGGAAQAQPIATGVARGQGQVQYRLPANGYPNQMSGGGPDIRFQVGGHGHGHGQAIHSMGNGYHPHQLQPYPAQQSFQALSYGPQGSVYMYGNQTSTLPPYQCNSSLPHLPPPPHGPQVRFPLPQPQRAAPPPPQPATTTLPILRARLKFLLRKFIEEMDSLLHSVHHEYRDWKRLVAREASRAALLRSRSFGGVKREFEEGDDTEWKEWLRKGNVQWWKFQTEAYVEALEEYGGFWQLLEKFEIEDAEEKKKMKGKNKANVGGNVVGGASVSGASLVVVSNMNLKGRDWKWVNPNNGEGRAWGKGKGKGKGREGKYGGAGESLGPVNKKRTFEESAAGGDMYDAEEGEILSAATDRSSRVKIKREVSDEPINDVEADIELDYS